MTTRNYRNYTDQDIIKYAAEVTSMAQLLVKLGLKPVGGNYSNMRKQLQRLNLECLHWTGQGWNKNKRLKDWSDYTKNDSIKPHLINERGNTCENCKLISWQKKQIPLELHHIDGNSTNNKKSNLQLLCPNCHALTNNWRGRKN